MLITMTHPTQVFMDAAKAQAIVDTLNATEADGATYKVVCRVKGRFIIAVYDAEGDFVFYL